MAARVQTERRVWFYTTIVRLGAVVLVRCGIALFTFYFGCLAIGRGMSDVFGGARNYALVATGLAFMALATAVAVATINYVRRLKSGIRIGMTDELRRRNCCPRCEYDLRASPERCPECGWSIPAKSIEV